jgi:hypothetical protein
MPAAHMIEPYERGEDLQGTVLVVGDERPVGGVGAGHHIGGPDIGFAVAGRLHNDRLHRPTQRLGLIGEPLGEVERGLQTFILEIAAIDQ